MEYKTLKITDSIDESAVILLEQFFAKYPKEDIYFEISDDVLTIKLHRLDTWSFQRDIEKLSQSPINDKIIQILKSIYNTIDKIKSYALDGKKRLYVGYNKERKVKGRKTKIKKRGMHYYANDNTFKQRNIEIPEDYVNQIICGDSEYELKKLPDNCIDLVFTSPPYNFGLDYTENEDDHHWESYFDKLFRIFTECIRVLKYGGRIIVNTQPLFSDYIPSHHIISNFFIQNRLIWKGEILWEKHNYNCKYTAWGSWRSPSNPYLKYTWEFLEIFCKGSLKKDGKRENIDIEGEEFKRWVFAKWSISPERKMLNFGHPAMFPEELVERVLKLFSFKDDVVLDPFNGVGTTTAVSKKFNRRFLGVDISKEYCQKALSRTNSIDIAVNLFQTKNGSIL